MNVPDLGAAGDLPCVAGDRPSRQDYSSSYLPEEAMNLDYWFLFVLFFRWESHKDQAVFELLM